MSRSAADDSIAEGSAGATSATVTTDDGRWIVVDGRRWRATDPSIPDSFRHEMVDELMDARRAIAAARRTSEPATEAMARTRVQQAKVALGERGDPWWDPPTEEGMRQRIQAAMLTLADHRAPDRTICPSDVARAVGGDSWRPLMDPVRDIARDLAREGRLEVSQKGQRLDPDGQWRGPVRIRSLSDPS